MNSKGASNFNRVGTSQRLSRFCIDCEPVIEATRLEKKKQVDSNYYFSNYENVREKQIWDRLKIRYGVTKEWFEDKMDQQEGVCAICGRPPSEKRLHVDHNHTSGLPRGLLCVTCNMRVGVLEDHKWRLSAYQYLEENDPSWIRELNE